MPDPHTITLIVTEAALGKVRNHLITKKLTGNLYGPEDEFCARIVMALGEGDAEVSVCTREEADDG